MKTILILFLFVFVNLSAQKSPPIIFGELGIGYGKVFSGDGGIAQYGSLNYEINKNLITARYMEHTQLDIGVIPISPFTPFPFLTSDGKIYEVGLLYGRRYTDDRFSYSFSGGFSGYNYSTYAEDENGNVYKDVKRYYGFPFEVNVKWFKSKKSPYRIYELIPVGRPSALGNSIGFKLFGTLSKHSYLGVGVVFGIGYHKNYE